MSKPSYFLVVRRDCFKAGLTPTLLRTPLACFLSGLHCDLHSSKPQVLLFFLQVSVEYLLGSFLVVDFWFLVLGFLFWLVGFF